MLATVPFGHNFLFDGYLISSNILCDGHVIVKAFSFHKSLINKAFLCDSHVIIYNFLFDTHLPSKKNKI